MKRTVLACLMICGWCAANAQLSGSVDVEGEYLPIIIETERLNVFPETERFELPPADLDYEYGGTVTDFRPSILSMGLTGPGISTRSMPRGCVDARLGSYLKGRLLAGYHFIRDDERDLKARLKFQTWSFDDRYYNAGLGVAYRSSRSPLRGWHASADFDYLHAPEPEIAPRPGYKPNDFLLELKGGYAFRLNDAGAIALDARTDFLFGTRDYGIISLAPAYRFRHGGVDLKAGVDLGLAYNDTRFRVAPDVRIAYDSHKTGVGFYLEARGGMTPQTASMRRELDRYGVPVMTAEGPIYTPVAARVGVKAGPYYGFGARISGGYTAMRGVPFWGRLHGFDVNLALKYAYGTWVELRAEGSYTPQRGTTGVFNGYDRPRWVLGAGVTARPVSRLKIDLDYELRACRMLPEAGLYADEKAKNTNMLTARVTYRVLDWLDVYARAENILCQRMELLPGLWSKRLIAQLGATFRLY